MADGKPLQFVIITGMSGAGKTQASHHFEDLGFFCVDNLPPALLPTFADLCVRSGVQQVAIVIDIRGGQFFNELSHALDALAERSVGHRILFLDADDETLVHRYKETRRRHPLATAEEDLPDCIRAERAALAEVRERADLIINTATIAPRELRDQIARTFLNVGAGEEILINIVSFGFKHGVPTDADLVFDVRFLTNPHYVPELKPLDGNYPQVVAYVLRDEVTQQYMVKLFDLMEFSLPHFISEGKAFLSVAIGCTGGQHRSVVVANELADFLRGKDYRVNVHHRDIRHNSRGAPGGGAA